MRAHGERDYPYECCGLMLGPFADGQKQVVETYAISNAREEAAKRNRFLIRPDELMRGEKYASFLRMRAEGLARLAARDHCQQTILRGDQRRIVTVHARRSARGTLRNDA